MLQYSDYFIRTMMAIAKQGAASTTGPLNGAIIILFKNAELPEPTDDVADFDQPTATGYAASTAVAWNIEIYNAGGVGLGVNAGLKNFVRTNGTDPAEVVTGWACVLSDESEWLIAELYDTPITWEEAGQLIPVWPQLALPWSQPEPMELPE